MSPDLAFLAAIDPQGSLPSMVALRLLKNERQHTRVTHAMRRLAADGFVQRVQAPGVAYWIRTPAGDNEIARWTA